MVSIVASCCSYVDMIVVVVAPTRRLGVNVFSWGRLIMIWGVWLSLKDCAIPANPDGHVYFFSIGLSRGADTHAKIVCLLGVVEVEVVATIVVEGMTRGLEHPRKGLVQKEPLG